MLTKAAEFSCFPAYNYPCFNTVLNDPYFIKATQNYPLNVFGHKNVYHPKVYHSQCFPCLEYSCLPSFHVAQNMWHKPNGFRKYEPAFSTANFSYPHPPCCLQNQCYSYSEIKDETCKSKKETNKRSFLPYKKPLTSKNSNDSNTKQLLKKSNEILDTRHFVYYPDQDTSSNRRKFLPKSVPTLAQDCNKMLPTKPTENSSHNFACRVSKIRHRHRYSKCEYNSVGNCQCYIN